MRCIRLLLSSFGAGALTLAWTIAQDAIGCRPLPCLGHRKANRHHGSIFSLRNPGNACLGVAFPRPTILAQ